MTTWIIKQMFSYHKNARKKEQKNRRQKFDIKSRNLHKNVPMSFFAWPTERHKRFNLKWYWLSSIFTKRNILYPKTCKPIEVHNESCSSQNFDDNTRVACDRYLYDPSGKNKTKAIELFSLIFFQCKSTSQAWRFVLFLYCNLIFSILFQLFIPWKIK